MYKIKFTSSYKINWYKNGAWIKLLDNVIDLLREGKKLPAKYKDHSLNGKFKNFRECHIQADWLLIYLIEEDIITLTLVGTGTHSDLFD